MNRRIGKYIDEFKKEAINLALKSPSAMTAKELDIPIGTLYTWIYTLKQ